MSKSELREIALAIYERYQSDKSSLENLGEEIKLTKRILAKAFGLSRSGLYYQPTKPTADLEIKNQIERWHQLDDTLGSRKLAQLIGKSRSCVSRVMIKYNLYPRRKRPEYRYPGRADQVIDNRLLKLSRETLEGYEILFSDIFQFRLEDGSWVYCCFVIRKKTRQILSFCYSWGMQAELVKESIKGININRTDLVTDLAETEIIFHSDQGKQYGAKITIDVCLEYHFERSMSRAGTPTDNPIAERFVQTFKLAVVERYAYRAIGEFEEFAQKWLNFYNNQRPHESLGQKSPNRFAQENDLKSVPYLSLNFV